MFLDRRIRHIKRYKNIVSILAKYGFGYLVQTLGLSELLPYHQKILQNANSQKEIDERFPGVKWARLRQGLEELGPTFIKMGQVLSTRPDLIPAELLGELEKLQDNVPPVAYIEVRDTIKQELGFYPEELFSSFSEESIAAASIGQVHKAVLSNGRSVVVKVQRSGIQDLINTDLEILFDLARLIERRTSWGKIYNLIDLVEEFTRTLYEELDYTREGRNADRFRNNFTNDLYAYFPEVYWEYTTRKVLTIELLEGRKVNNLLEENTDGLRKEFAENFVKAMFKQILLDGFFHADPHPGNLIILKEGIVGFIDFGMVGRLSDDMREHFVNLLLSFSRKSSSEIIKIIIDMGVVKPETNINSFRREIDYINQQYYDLPLEQLYIGEFFSSFVHLTTKYQIKLPPEFILLIKAIITIEGIVKQMDPKISIVNLVKPFGKKLARERLSPSYWKKVLYSNFAKNAEFFLLLPERLNSLLVKMIDGEIKFKHEHQHVGRIIRRIGVLLNRLSFSIVIAALIIGSSLASLRSHTSLFGKLPVSEVTFLLAVIFGLWLLFSILRSERL